MSKTLFEKTLAVHSSNLADIFIFREEFEEISQEQGFMIQALIAMAEDETPLPDKKENYQPITPWDYTLGLDPSDILHLSEAILPIGFAAEVGYCCRMLIAMGDD